jgi:arginase family enzyme
VDLDVLDTTIGRANTFATPGGLCVDDVCGVIDTLRPAGDQVALALTAYDPDCDPEGSILDAAVRIAIHWATR